MRHGRNKRSRSNKDADGDIYMNTQGEDIHSDSYSRSHSSFHLSENYRGPSTSGRTTYVSDRDISSRSGRDDDWRHADLDHDRFSYGDHFSRGERSKYEDNAPRSSTGWGIVDSPPYVQPRNDWSRRYDNAVSSSSYPETSTWGIPPPAPYDTSRTSYHERWDQNDSRDQPLDDWGSESGRLDHRSERRSHDWRSDGQRDKRHGHKFQSDSGWESRRRERSTWGTEQTKPQEDPLLEQRHHTVEDRAWEPAASWKSSTNNDHQQQRGQNGQRTNQPKGKRGQNQNKQRREWRADDGDLNNWTRRDARRDAIRDAAWEANNKPPVSQHTLRRKHLRSPSPSRSRSPTESYRSRRSSRGRSRSRSFSPANKRRRRDSSPVTLRSRTPSDRSLNRSYARQERCSSRSPSPNRSPISLIERHRSPSVVSSTGSDRSRSKSPLAHTRSVHRLPPNHHRPTGLPNVIGKSIGNGNTTRKKDDLKNGKSRSHKQHRRPRDSRPQAAAQGDYDISRNDDRTINFSMAPPPPANKSPQPITISMPPPSSVPPPHGSRPRYVTQEYDSPASTWTMDSKIDIAGKATRGIPARNAGFKPIGKVNPSLKKFFPSDEEETSEEPRLPGLSGLDIGTENSLPSYHDLPLLSGWGEPEPPSSQDQRGPVHQPAEALRDSNCNLSNLYPLPSFDQLSSVPRNENSRPGNIPPTLESTSSLNDHKRQSPRLVNPSDLPSRPSHEMQPSPPDNHGSSSAAALSTSNKDLYKIVSQVGEGTFGKVYKARNTITGAHVALKRIRMEAERDGFPVTAMREIKLLQSLRHDNIVRLHEMMVSNGSVYMVFEYMDHDLTGVLSQSQFVFLDEHLKSLCLQMLAGLAYLHRKGVVHRDIKGSNILINNRGELKLADFGLARFYQKRRRADYTNRVITLWYRPPELLFGATVYGPEVDMWSAGCIMLELFTKKPVFQGVDEIHQLEVIFKLLGTPTPERWADVVNLPWYELVKPQQVLPSRFREAFQKWMSPAALDLAEQLLTYDPMRRITARQAMNSDYFLREQPVAAPPVGLVDLEGEWHELETKRERAKRKERKITT